MTVTDSAHAAFLHSCSRTEMASAAILDHLGVTAEAAAADPSLVARVVHVSRERNGHYLFGFQELHLDGVPVWRGWWDTDEPTVFEWREECLTPWMREALGAE